MNNDWLKCLLEPRYLYVEVQGIFRDSIYSASPQNLYYTVLIIPVSKADVQDFVKNPNEFMYKVIREIHPEMRGFMICGLRSCGWYYKEEAINQWSPHVQESILKITYSNNGPFTLKPIYVTYRTFHFSGMSDEVKNSIGYHVKRYIQTVLEAFIKHEVEIGDWEIEIWK